MLIVSRCIWLVVVWFALAFPVFAQSVVMPKGMSAGPCVEGVCEYRLQNGLRILLFADASKPTVTVNLVYGVGSVHENYGETGMAHLLEHMLFKGTPRHPDIPGEMRKRGVQKNASTSLERTNYYASFPANDDTLDWVLDMEADRMVNSTLSKSDLDSEMTVVRNEMESGDNNPGSVLFKRMRAVAYDWHNYAHLPIGARSDVEGVPIENLQRFYRTWYQPDNALLVIAGRIDSSAVLQRVNKYFSALQPPKRKLPVFHTVEPAQDGEREVSVRRSGDIGIVALVYHVPASSQADSAALSVLANMLRDVPNGRLYKALMETKLAASTSASGNNQRDPGLFSLIAALPKDGDASKVEAELLQQAEGFSRQPATAEEVAAAKQRIANDYEKLLSDVNAVGMAFSESQAAGDWRLLFVQRDAIAKVSADDVNRVAASYLKSSNRTLGRFIPTDAPDRAEIPAAPALATLVDGYTGNAAIAAGEAFEATPQNIAARSQTFTLGEGLKVTLLPKKNRGETVVFNASFRFADEQSVSGRSEAASMAGTMLMLGSKSMSREQIAARFDALNTQALVSGSLQSAQIYLSGKRETLADAVALAADVLRNPAFPVDQFEQKRLQLITGNEAQRTEPGSVAGIALAQHFDVWPEGHPYHVDTLDERLRKLKSLRIEEVAAYHRDFYGTAEGEIAVVGDFDAQALKAQLQQLFVAWKAPVAYAPIHTHYHDIQAKRDDFHTPDKPNAVFLARQNLSLNLLDADFPALSIATSILGGDALKARLADRIRQKEGLSYGATATLRADDSRSGRDDNGSLSIRAIVAPQNIAKLETAVREEYQRLVQDGVSEEELRDAISNKITSRQQGRAQDRSVASVLSNHLHYARSMQFEIERDAAYQALTVEQVNAALRKHFKPQSLSVFVAGDLQ